MLKKIFCALVVLLSYGAHAQLHIIPASKSGFPDCVFRNGFNETSFYSTHVYMRVHERNADSTHTFFALIMVHELYRIIHESDSIDLCKFRDLMTYYMWSGAPINVNEEEYDLLKPYKRNEDNCAIKNMGLDEFINHYFIKDKASGDVHLKSNNLSRQEEDCIFIKLFTNRIVSMTGYESPTIEINEKPCYFD